MGRACAAEAGSTEAEDVDEGKVERHGEDGWRTAVEVEQSGGRQQ